MQSINNEIFGRINEDGNVSILMTSDGAPVTRIDANLYPVDSDVSTRYEHPEGIVLTLGDAKAAGITIE
jgi:hypothetical protein